MRRMDSTVSAQRWTARVGVVLCGCVLVSLAGCFAPFARPTQLIQRFHPAAGPAGPDTVALEIALLEIPISESKNLAAVWNAADEQVVPAQYKAKLDDNGFRVGVIGGIPPSALLNFLTSERTNPSPHRCLKKAGDPRLLTLRPARAECQFQLHKDGAITPAQYEQAQLDLEVVPSVQANGVHLQLMPQIQHGRRTLWPTADGAGGWGMQGQRPVERLTYLKFEIDLSANDYLLVGARDKPNTLGPQCFTSDGDKPGYRLLAIRAGRLNGGAAEPVAQNGLGTPPLAVQAAGIRSRGSPWP